MKNRRIVLFWFLCCSLSMMASELSLLNKEAVAQSIKTNQEWVPFPDYEDRQGWTDLLADQREALIAYGETALTHQWRYIPRTVYLEYFRTGVRSEFEELTKANNTALMRLIIAELAEGEGRFIDQIINGIYFECERSSWVNPAHFPLSIDLSSGELGAMLSWVYYFFHNAFDRVDATVNQRIINTVNERILVPYMNDNPWWLGLKGERTNNWNVWCNFNCAQCFLLIEKDPAKRSAAIERTMLSVDRFIDGVKPDGACEEGPSYWESAAGKLLDYLELMYYVTDGLVDLSQSDKVRNMGEYFVNTQIGNHWVVNFADATAQYKNNVTDLIYRFGRYTGSPVLASYARQLKAEFPAMRVSGTEIWRVLNSLKDYPNISASATGVSGKDVWYEGTEFFYKRKGAWFFAAKSGHNGESHNHNDIGSCLLFYDNEPLLIDAGTGTYTKQTFSEERYSLWMMQSGWHNLPVINGVEQKDGKSYKGQVKQANVKKGVFSVDIAGAYPKEACVDSWVRTYQLTQSGLMIKDTYRLSQTNHPNEVHFLFHNKEDINRLRYDTKLFNARVVEKPLTDVRLTKIWGDTIYCLVLSARQMNETGTYSFVIQ